MRVKILSKGDKMRIIDFNLKIKNPPRDNTQGGELFISVLRFLQEEFRLLIVGLLVL